MRSPIRKEGRVIVSFISFLLNTCPNREKGTGEEGNGGTEEQGKRGTGEQGKGEGETECTLL
jgi:hypothetical protein